MTSDPSRKGRVRASIVAAFIALVAIPVGIAGPVAAAPDSSSSPVDKYVALGDSVAAGQGGGPCQRYRSEGDVHGGRQTAQEDQNTGPDQQRTGG